MSFYLYICRTVAENHGQKGAFQMFSLQNDCPTVYQHYFAATQAPNLLWLLLVHLIRRHDIAISALRRLIGQQQQEWLQKTSFGATIQIIVK